MTDAPKKPPVNVARDKQLEDRPKPREFDLQGVLEVEAPEVLVALPKDKRKRLLDVIRAVSVTETHVGPIPRPEDVAEYNRHIPDGANRIMQMAEEQSKHRIEMERIIVINQQSQSGRGQVFGLII